MSVVSPIVLRTALRDYEPWGRLRGEISGRPNPGDRDDNEWLESIDEIGSGMRNVSDAQLQACSEHLLKRARDGESLDTYLAEAFALAREASRRVLGLYHYDVQILGGLAICRGTIAEMATGEGKTLVQSLAAYARGLSGKGVHVATANAYLAQRDFEFAAPLFEFLGLSAALLPERVAPAQKRRAYEADVTYGTGTEFGFDYLRDQVELMRFGPVPPGESYRRNVLGLESCKDAALAQRGLPFAIIDEIDSILIDEASTPLVISEGSSGEHGYPEVFQVAEDVSRTLKEAEDFVVEQETRTLRLTESGLARIEVESSEVPSGSLRRPWQTYIENALRSELLFSRDTDYVVEEDSGKVVIVDSNTGRIREGSSWREGLHQAVEQKERVSISAESCPIAGISRQRFYRLYEGLGGMTGTATEAAGEFWRFYRLQVVPIRRNRPSKARSYPPRIFRKPEEKYEALVGELRFRSGVGQPVLVGCGSIEESETVSAFLSEAMLPHTLLNAKSASEEAEIIAAAGAPGTITIATNMAGRGTHISLSEASILAGGLHVIATSMDASKRIDRQLMGRSARQGEPGSHQFFLCGEDPLIRQGLPEVATRLTSSKQADEIGEVDGSKYLKSFERAQRKREREGYEQRVSQFHYNELNNEIKEILT